VDGDVGGLRQHSAIAQEDGTAKVEPLFDVGTVSGATQGDAHFFSNGGKKMAKYGKGNGRCRFSHT
jgi:hypothetical protein